MNKREKIYHETEICEFRKVKCHDCADLKKDLEYLKMKMTDMQDQLNQLIDNQQVVIRTSKDQVQHANELKDMLQEMKKTLTNSIKQAIQS